VPRDLETVCLKCLDKEPHRRYPSAVDLADDLHRFLAGQPVHARPVGAGERLAKWARRRPAAAALVLTTGLALLALVGIVTAAFYSASLLEAKQRAEAQQRRAEMYQYFHHIARAHAGWREGDLVRMEALLDACPPEQRRWEWHYLKRLCQADLFTLKNPRPVVYAVAFSPDGSQLAWGGWGLVTVGDAATGKTIRTLQRRPGWIRFVAFSPDGKRLASASEDDHRVIVWNVATGQVAVTLKGHTAEVRQAVFSPNGARLATASHDGTVRVWDARTGAELKRLEHNDRVFGVAFSPDGARLASTCQDETVRVWDVAAGRDVLRLEKQGIWLRFVQFSPDGTRLAVGGDHTVKVWDAKGRESLTLRGHTGDVWSVAFSPDGTRLASAGVDQTVKVWDVATGQRTHILIHVPGEAVSF
jgi:hypothetical protein